MNPIRAIVSLTVFLSCLLLTEPAYSQITCHTCNGSADANAGNSASCPSALVAISVVASNANCLPVIVVPPGFSYCSAQDCKATITRSWSNVDANTAMDFCYVVTPYGGTPLPRQCRDTDPSTPGTQGPNSGTGSGTDTEEQAMKCGLGVYVYAISATCGGGAARISATASVTCDDHCD